MDLATISNYLSNYGLLCIFIIIFLEYINLPGLPGGIIIPLVGAWVASTKASFLLALIVSVIAGLLGSILLYFLGLYGGEVIIEKFLRRFPKQRERIDNIFEKLKSWGNVGIFIGKLIPAVRTIISVPAGVIKVNFVKFTVYSTLGILVWNGVLMALGYIFGDFMVMSIK